MARIDRQTLAAFMEDELSSAQRDEVAAALDGSAVLTDQLEQLKSLRATLCSPPTAVASIDVTLAVRSAIDTGGVRASQSGRGRGRALLLQLGGLAAAAMAVLGLVTLGPDTRRGVGAGLGAGGAPARATADTELAPGIRVKGKLSAADTAERAQRPRFFLHVVDSDDRSRPMGLTVKPSDGWLVSYENAKSAPFPYLMVFARDAAGSVHWVYPAYTDVVENPRSISIEQTSARVTLPDVVTHDPARGVMEIIALFSRVPLSIREVETWLSTQHALTLGSAVKALVRGAAGAREQEVFLRRTTVSVVD